MLFARVGGAYLPAYLGEKSTGRPYSGIINLERRSACIEAKPSPTATCKDRATYDGGAGDFGRPSASWLAIEIS